MIHLAIRGYAAGVLQFEDLLEAGEDKLQELLPDLAGKHVEALLEHRLHMIEIEFLDEPNPVARFFRFGSDPSGMVMPIMVILSKDADADRPRTEKTLWAQMAHRDPSTDPGALRRPLRAVPADPAADRGRAPRSRRAKRRR